MSGGVNETGPAAKSPVDASPAQLKALQSTLKCFDTIPAIPVTDQISRLIGAVATAPIDAMEIGAKVLAFDETLRKVVDFEAALYSR